MSSESSKPVTFYDIPHEAHTSYARAQETASYSTGASLSAARSAHVIDRIPKPSAFDQLFNLRPNGIIFLEGPPSQVASLYANWVKTPFGSSQTIESQVTTLEEMVATTQDAGAKSKIDTMIEALKQLASNEKEITLTRARMASIIGSQ